MKQLYYTSCRSGKSVSGSSGFQVRAVSPDVPAEHIRAAVRYAGYSLPSNMSPIDKTEEPTPVRLCFLDTPELGVVVCHSVYVGRDPTTQRQGNFFSHLLFEVPVGLHAGHVIGSWGSEFWHREDDDGDCELPLANNLPTTDQFDRLRVKEFLKHSSQYELIRFLLRALLILDSTSRIFVAAPAQDIALCVYALTCVLPHGMLERLTFSTYERDPLLCPARLIGTSWGVSGSGELPSSCYGGGSVAYNHFTGKQSSIEGDAYYADFALKALKAETAGGQLEKFRRTCDRLGINEGPMLELVYRCCKKDLSRHLPKESLSRALDDPTIAGWVFKSSPELMDQMVSCASGDTTFLQSILPKLATFLKFHPQAVTGWGLSHETCACLDVWLAPERFVDAPRLDEATVIQVANALKQQPKELLKQSVSMLAVPIASALVANAQSRDLTPDDVTLQLRNVLHRLGPFFSGDSAGLYKKLLNICSKQHASWKNVDLQYALLYVACSDVFAGKIDRRQTRRHVKQLKSEDRATYNIIKARALKWTRSMRSCWKRASRLVPLWMFAGASTVLLVLIVLSVILAIRYREPITDWFHSLGDKVAGSQAAAVEWRD